MPGNEPATKLNLTVTLYFQHSRGIQEDCTDDDDVDKLAPSHYVDFAQPNFFEDEILQPAYGGGEKLDYYNSQFNYITHEGANLKIQLLQEAENNQSALMNQMPQQLISQADDNARLQCDYNAFGDSNLPPSQVSQGNEDNDDHSEADSNSNRLQDRGNRQQSTMKEAQINQMPQESYVSKANEDNDDHSEADSNSNRLQDMGNKEQSTTEQAQNDIDDHSHADSILEQLQSTMKEAQINQIPQDPYVSQANEDNDAHSDRGNKEQLPLKTAQLNTDTNSIIVSLHAVNEVQGEGIQMNYDDTHLMQMTYMVCNFFIECFTKKTKYSL
jgi:hypothetical protein